MLLALAICCVGPMLLIVVLTSVVGVALGWATALALGLVAAGVCIALIATTDPVRGVNATFPVTTKPVTDDGPGVSIQ